MIYFCVLAYVVAVFVRPAEIWFDFPFVDVLAVVTLVVALLTYRKRPRKFWDLPHDKFIVGLWIAVVVSNLEWGWLGGAWLGFSDFFKICFFYFAIRFAVREVRQVQGFIATIVIVNLVLAISGIVQYHWGVGLGGVPLMPDHRIRGTGILNDPNDLALSLVMAVPFLLEEIGAVANGILRRVASAVLLAPLLIAVAYTASRGGMLSLAIILTAYAAIRLSRIAGAIALGVAILVTVTWGPARLLNPTSAESESTQIRLHAWGAGLIMLRSEPLLGVGYTRFQEFHDAAAHSSYASVFAELGVFGLFFWIGLLYFLVKGLLPRRDAAPTLVLDRIRSAVLASVVAVFVSSIFLSRQYVLIPYTLIGLGASYVPIANREGAGIDTRFTARDFVAIVVLCVGVIAATWLWVRLFAGR